MFQIINHVPKKRFFLFQIFDLQNQVNFIEFKQALPFKDNSAI